MKAFKRVFGTLYPQEEEEEEEQEQEQQLSSLVDLRWRCR